jgi:hypothetical protein
MKGKSYIKYLTIGIVGLFILTTINPVGAILNNNIQENKSQTETATVNTYSSRTTNLYCSIDNLTDVHYHKVIIYPSIFESILAKETVWFGVYRDITVSGTAEQLWLWYPLLGASRIIPQSLYTFENKIVTLEVKLLLFSTVSEFTNPNSIEISGRAIGVTLTVEE